MTAGDATLNMRPSSICNRLWPVLRAHADGRLLYCSSRHTGITSTFPAAGQTLPHPPAPHTKASTGFYRRTESVDRKQARIAEPESFAATKA